MSHWQQPLTDDELLFVAVDEPDDGFTLRQFEENNWDSPDVYDMVGALRRLDIGETVSFGGGASAIMKIRRVS